MTKLKYRRYIWKDCEPDGEEIHFVSALNFYEGSSTAAAIENDYSFVRWLDSDWLEVEV